MTIGAGLIIAFINGDTNTMLEGKNKAKVQSKLGEFTKPNQQKKLKSGKKKEDGQKKLTIEGLIITKRRLKMLNGWTFGENDQKFKKKNLFRNVFGRYYFFFPWENSNPLIHRTCLINIKTSYYLIFMNFSWLIQDVLPSKKKIKDQVLQTN